MSGDLHSLVATSAAFRDVGKQLRGFVDLLTVHQQVRASLVEAGCPRALCFLGRENFLCSTCRGPDSLGESLKTAAVMRKHVQEFTLLVKYSGGPDLAPGP